MNITNHPASDNYSMTRFGSKVDMIVLHTMDGFLAGTDSWFNNPASDVSTHYGVGLNGRVHRYVSEGDTAWANGDWNVNKRSISIEAEDNKNPQGIMRTPEQLEAVAELVADICFRYNLPCNRSVIKEHREVYPKKPSCPGNLPTADIVNRASTILAARRAPQVVQASVSHVSTAAFPRTITVTAGSLRVRRAPNLSAEIVWQPAPDGLLHQGQTFVATGVVKGVYVAPTDQWLRSSRGNYVWAGGTNFPFDVAPQEPKSVPVPVVEPEVAEVVEVPVTVVAQPAPEVDAVQPAEPDWGPDFTPDRRTIWLKYDVMAHDSLGEEPPGQLVMERPVRVLGHYTDPDNKTWWRVAGQGRGRYVINNEGVQDTPTGEAVRTTAPTTKAPPGFLAQLFTDPVGAILRLLRGGRRHRSGSNPLPSDVPEPVNGGEV